MKLPINIDEDELQAIEIMGISSRMLNLESNKKKTFVVLGGQHTSIERMYAIAQFLNDYGEVKLIDLPGFGGVDNFRKINKKITLDNYAEYLKDFIIKQDIQNFDFFATSFSSLVVTRMLQLYPQMQKRVNKVILFVGFNSGNDFRISRPSKTAINILTLLTANPVGAYLFKIVFTNRFSLRAMLWLFAKFKGKMKSNDKKKVMDNIAMEYQLWTKNDRETHARSTRIMFNVDLTNHTPVIDGFCHNIITDSDQYFDNKSVNSGFEKIYKKYETSSVNLAVHAPSLIASKKDVAKFMSKNTISTLKN